ncbi:uncharacterized protein LOC112685131 [Sipha flava]|uniref:Uncharacterized protein LOC112685131 n=1 Tax=Sipha flava TaxID=143950 RepID=A0A8B8FP41_9HEMI|nr:uncharacterized protein LOC112685131 [Sipha flava]
MKQFSLTLYYYSPKSYNFCRTILTLLHPSSITNWTSSVKADPGFLEEVFEYLKKIPDGDKDWYCDFGGIQVEAHETPATETLVFMLVDLNGKWKWLIGYFLQSKSTASVQAG